MDENAQLHNPKRLIPHIQQKTVKAVFHFNRIVAKRNVFHCFVTSRVELMTCTQWNTLRCDTVEVEKRRRTVSANSMAIKNKKNV